MQPIEFLAAATAMSLYQYNVEPIERASRIYKHFGGACADGDIIRKWVDDKHWATVMPGPTALVYLSQAMEQYGSEALERSIINTSGRRLRAPERGDG